MTNIVIPTPPSMQVYREHLREFFAGMMRKLDMNSHKSTPQESDIPTMINLLTGELQEFRDQFISNSRDPNVLVELYDVANYAFLMTVALRNAGTQTTKEHLINEWLDIRPDEGKIFCKKTRAGSQYKVGEEIRGTNRNGYIDIRLQSARYNGRGLIIPRSHLIWWKHTGSWPIGVIDHINRNRSDDRAINLRDINFSQNSFNSDASKKRLLPRYVTRYLPSGRQHLKHYGKYVYQRNFRGTTIRAAYYDTPEAASIKGSAAWRSKVLSKFTGLRLSDLEYELGKEE